MKKKIVIIDVLNMFCKQFAGSPKTDHNGEHIGGLMGSLNFLKNIIRKHEPNFVYCAWEGKGSAERRRKTFNNYKQGRKFHGFNRIFEGQQEQERDSFKEQMIKLKKYLDVLPFHQGIIDFLEADDVVAYLTTNVFRNEDLYEVIIVSTDKDYYQLVTPNVSVYRSSRRFRKNNDVVENNIAINIDNSQNKKDYENENGQREKIDGELITYEYMLEGIGCYPKNWPIVKSLTKDDSDKIKGIAGVGLVTALKDFPFLKEEEEFEIQKVINYSKEQLENGNAKYKKYTTKDAEKLLYKNYKLVQLIDPNISMRSIYDIEKSVLKEVTKITPNHLSKLRMLFAKDRLGFIGSEVNNFIDAFSIKPTTIEIE